ncbi:MAG: hypothetical protein Terrestrivirus11_1, partial [Terrestrivirus sp.]
NADNTYNSDNSDNSDNYNNSDNYDSSAKRFNDSSNYNSDEMKGGYSDSEKIAIKEIEIVDKILGMFPEMKKSRNLILTEILTPKKIPDNEYTLEKIIIYGKSYYIDKYKCILDENIQLVGVWEYKTGIIKYHIFDHDNIIFNEIKNKYKNMNLKLY